MEHVRNEQVIAWFARGDAIKVGAAFFSIEGGFHADLLQHLAQPQHGRLNVALGHAVQEETVLNALRLPIEEFL